MCVPHINTPLGPPVISRLPPPFPIMSATSEPLKKQRLIALTLCWIWSVVAACVGLNALIKFVHCHTPMGSISHSLSLGLTRQRPISGSSLPQASHSYFISMVSTSLFCHNLRLFLSPAQISINLASSLRAFARLWPSLLQSSSSSRSSGQNTPLARSRFKRGS